jgi:hypothetical protein
MRANAMLHILYGYEDPTVAIAADLRTALQAHFDAVFPDAAGTTIAPDRIATQFGRTILIQPLVLGQLQYQAQMTLLPMDPYVGTKAAAQGDPYDVQKPMGWSTLLDTRAYAALSDATSSTALLGADLATAPDLLPAARASGFRVPWRDVNPAAEAALTQRFGALGRHDGYLTSFAATCQAPVLYDSTFGNWFLDNLRYDQVFLTHARYDAVIYVPAIAYTLQTMAGLPVTVDTTPDDASATRPGWMRFTLPAGTGAGMPAKAVSIRYPSYDASGHMVAVTQAADLAADVSAWLAATAP